MEKAANANFIVFGLNPKLIALVASTLTIPIYDFSLQNSLAHCKYNCNEKSIKLTDPIRFLIGPVFKTLTAITPCTDVFSCVLCLLWINHEKNIFF